MRKLGCLIFLIVFSQFVPLAHAIGIAGGAHSSHVSSHAAVSTALIGARGHVGSTSDKAVSLAALLAVQKYPTANSSFPCMWRVPNFRNYYVDLTRLVSFSTSSSIPAPKSPYEKPAAKYSFDITFAGSIPNVSIALSNPLQADEYTQNLLTRLGQCSRGEY